MLNPKLNPMLISVKSCEGKGWRSADDLKFAQAMPLIPIHGGELAQAGSSMPVALIKQDKKWQLVAVCGQTENHNLFVKNGKWLGNYQPQWLNTYPFSFLQLKNQAALMFDQESGLLCEPGEGEAFFNDEGEPNPQLAGAIELLKGYHQKLQVTQKALQALETAKVIVPWSEELKKGVHCQLTGLFKIDERKLNELDDASYLALRKAQAIPIAYGINFSIHQGHLLQRLARINPAPNSPMEDLPDLDSLFNEDSDTITFG